jgi:hypothetical protein
MTHLPFGTTDQKSWGGSKQTEKDDHLTFLDITVYRRPGFLQAIRSTVNLPTPTPHHITTLQTNRLFSLPWYTGQEPYIRGTVSMIWTSSR